MLFKKKDKQQNISQQKLPNHIAFIMDGNGRWAKKRGLPRSAGHSEGGKALLKVLNKCNELHIKAVTVYAFSTENWKRPKDEVEFLMSLPSKYINTYLPKIKESNIIMKFIGNLDELSDILKADINKSIEETKNNTGLIFTVAINYGSQDEMLYAIKKVSKDVLEKKVLIDDINKEYFESKLMTHGMPNIDLLIRTSGEIRISNFLLWQIAYSELYFTDQYWPDFDEVELYKALSEYQRRNRRFGGVEEV
ncbi:MAG: pyrophosphate synthase [Haloplasmataceae bacterium]|jgi:undecaprenyl diphosphate synthase|nr:pyrophosphate synthase [Haloplasmataceae bacterium]